MTIAGTTSMPAQLKRQVLRDGVYEALLDMLLEEQLKPGASLSIDALARELGISPTPVREALAYLEHTGLVARAALKGYTVAPRLSPAQLAELSDARTIIEVVAVERAAERASELLPDLREAHEAHLVATAIMVESGSEGTLPSARSMRKYFDADWGFHLVLVEASGNRFLREMLQGLGTHLHRLVQSADRGVTDWEAALSEHGQVLAAIEAADPVQAVSAMRTHLRGALDRALAESVDPAVAAQ
ncbi:GntR family transcriptional regulator [Arthrobacter sp. H14]|uniref:GntR family transcriptional regulator n=1 Tax=Arthrobacter sp. H14 TaxID=1312959 RepID=UPI000683E35F|nr:GntR family transcriptional regulator [Arthrobacter sp. H14]